MDDKTDETNAFIKDARACLEALRDNLAKTNAVLEYLRQAGPLPESTLNYLQASSQQLADTKAALRELGEKIAARHRPDASNAVVNPPASNPDTTPESN